MASRAQKSAAVIGASLLAASAASSLVVEWEGWVTKVGPDPIGIPTGCAGVTKGVRPGQVLTDAQCQQMTAQALTEHAVGIAQCLPDKLPNDTRAAFVSLSYNLGVAGFCSSKVAKLAREGRLGEACGALNLYVYAGKQKLPGLVTRRAAEAALCWKGLRS
jgi:lysozyme